MICGDEERSSALCDVDPGVVLMLVKCKVGAVPQGVSGDDPFVSKVAEETGEQPLQALRAMTMVDGSQRACRSPSSNIQLTICLVLLHLQVSKDTVFLYN